MDLENNQDKNIDLETLELVNKAKAGDEISMNAIIAKYKGLLVRKAIHYFLSDGTFEDLYQEASLGLVKAIRSYDYDKNPNLSSYLTMCVTTQILDAVRASTRKKNAILNQSVSLDDITEESTPEELNPIELYLLNEETSNFHDVLSKYFSEEKLKVLQLYLQGYTYQEISKMLNITTKKIDNTLASIKKKIRDNKELFL